MEDSIGEGLRSEVSLLEEEQEKLTAGSKEIAMWLNYHPEVPEYSAHTDLVLNRPKVDDKLIPIELPTVWLFRDIV